jgi:hypothetical protein
MLPVRRNFELLIVISPHKLGFNLRAVHEGFVAEKWFGCRYSLLNLFNDTVTIAVNEIVVNKLEKCKENNDIFRSALEALINTMKLNQDSRYLKEKKRYLLSVMIFYVNEILVYLELYLFIHSFSIYLKTISITQLIQRRMRR